MVTTQSGLVLADDDQALRFKMAEDRKQSVLLRTENDGYDQPLELSGFEDEHTKRLILAKHFLRKSRVATLKPMLPLLLELKGKPYKLHDHFPFEPFFRTRMPKIVLLKTGRQVSKSTSLAAQGVVFSNSIPFFSTLYVTPLFEMIRRFSHNYVRNFLETSPAKRLFTGSKQLNSVLQRNFKNGSAMYFSYAFLDAERTRGIPADKNVIDESVHPYTTVQTPTGWKYVIDVRPGDMVASFTITGEKVWKKVLNFWYHGARRLYKLTTSTGRHVEVTADTKLATNAGWLRVSQIIEIAAARKKEQASPAARECSSPDRDSKSTIGGHAFGRRTFDTKRQLRGGTRLAAARVPLDEAYLDVRIRRWDAFLREEQVARAHLQDCQVLDCADTGIALLTDASLPFRRQDGDERIDSLDEHAGLLEPDGVVDSGRWDQIRTPTFSDPDDLYARFHFPRGRTLVQLGDGSRIPVLASQGSAQRLPRLLDDDVFGAVGVEIDAGYSSLYATADALQVAGVQSYGLQDMHFLWEEVHHALRSGDDPDSIIDLLLHSQEVSETEEQNLLRQGDGEPDLPREPLCFEEGEVRFERGDSGIPQALFRKASRRESGAIQGVCAEALEKESRGTCGEAVPVSSLRKDGVSRRGSNRSRVVQDVPAGKAALGGQDDLSQEKGEHGGSKKSDCFAEEVLVSVEDMGVQDVFDIEVEGTHTVFFNGIGGIQCQDLNYDFLQIIHETLSGSPWALKQYAGTPKSLDNTMEKLWQDSSQAEWMMKCQTGSCGYWNVPALSWDLYDMIGKWHKEISEKCPGVICAKCTRPLNPRLGRWVHAYPERRWSFAGYHVPQIIMPMHYSNQEKWDALIGKQRGRNNTTPTTFLNEVCGESCDAGAKLVTETDLKNACNLGYPREAKRAVQHIGKYIRRILAVDWGGGGGRLSNSAKKTGEQQRLRTSFTTIAVLGMRPTGLIDVIWGHRSLRTHDFEWEARLCLEALTMFKCTHIAHDYSNAGEGRLVLLYQAGLPPTNIINIAYHGAKHNIITYHEASDDNPHDWYSLDKSRSLVTTCQCIKHGLINFFDYDYKSNDDAGLMRDFLALIEEKVDSRAGTDVYMIVRNPNLSDDFAHSVNYGACALWNMTNKWPNIAAAAKMIISPSTLKHVHPVSQVDWDDI